MKKMMRNIMAALVALACVPVTGMTAAALDMPWYWGETSWDAFEGEEPINDRGMLTGEDGFLYDGSRVTSYDIGDGTMREETVNLAYLVTPDKHRIKFVLRENTELNHLEEVVIQTLEPYYPGISDAFEKKPYYADGDEDVYWTYQNNSVALTRSEIYFGTAPENAGEVESKLLLALAQNHLITAFYGFGATGLYSECWFNPDPLDGIAYHDSTQDADWNSVQAYLDAHHPGYTVETYENGSEYSGYIFYTAPPHHRISGTDALSFREKIELAGELYENFGLVLPGISPCEDAKTTLGHNALENPGDVTLDCEIDIMDVIALNKQLLGAETLCDTAKKNSDINGNGSPDETDSLAILKYVVGLTETIGE